MGVVTKVTGLAIETFGPRGRVGELCKIVIPDDHSTREVYGEIVGFSTKNMVVMPYFEVEGIFPGCEVKTTNEILSVKVGKELLGRVLDGIGRPMDGKARVILK